MRNRLMEKGEFPILYYMVGSSLYIKALALHSLNKINKQIKKLQQQRKMVMILGTEALILVTDEVHEQ